MRKILLILLPLALLIGSSPAAASDLQTTENEIKALDKQIQTVVEEIKALPEEERSGTINKKIDLVMKKNELEALAEAFRKATNPYEIELNASQPLEYSGSIKLAPGQKVPSEYMPYYMAAGEKFGVDWAVLASIHKIETDFSRLKTMISSAGASGHMQFMPATWTSYGVDGSGDGMANIWDLKDSIFSAANYLSKSGFAKDQRKAVWHYNHAEWYVDEVLSVAASYRAAYTVSSLDVLNVADRYINNSKYVFGGGRNQGDISRGRFDCSSFVHWAFNQTGRELGPLTSVTTDTLKKLGKEIDPADIQPGDLVFFDTYKIDGHVGIYAGNGMFLGAQESTGVALADMTKGYWKEKFNGRVKRL